MHTDLACFGIATIANLPALLHRVHMKQSSFVLTFRQDHNPNFYVFSLPSHFQDPPSLSPSFPFAAKETFKSSQRVQGALLAPPAGPGAKARLQLHFGVIRSHSTSVEQNMKTEANVASSEYTLHATVYSQLNSMHAHIYFILVVFKQPKHPRPQLQPCFQNHMHSPLSNYIDNM